MYIVSYEEIDVIENIASKENNTAKKIKEAIIEMNIMRKKRISRDSLMKLIRDNSY